MAVHITEGIWYCIGIRNGELADLVYFAEPMAPAARVLIHDIRYSSCSL